MILFWLIYVCFYFKDNTELQEQLNEINTASITVEDYFTKVEKCIDDIENTSHEGSEVRLNVHVREAVNEFFPDFEKKLQYFKEQLHQKEFSIVIAGKN